MDAYWFRTSVRLPFEFVRFVMKMVIVIGIGELFLDDLDQTSVVEISNDILLGAGIRLCDRTSPWLEGDKN
jgi:hypothetical protein